MRLFLLSILIALGAVHAYEYRSNFQAYTTGHGDLKMAVGHGYIHYFDDNGVDHLFSYEYPDPLYLVRSLSYTIFGEPSVTYLPSENQFTEQEKKARYDHFFMWADKRYEAFKIEMDRLKSMGQNSPKDMISKFECLGKILQSRKYPLDSTDPAVKRLLDEHLRIWHEARLKVSQWQNDRLSSSIDTKGQTSIKSQSITSSGSTGYKSWQSVSSSGYAGVKTAPGFQSDTYKSYVPIGETDEQKKAHEEHIRIYNEHRLGVQKAEEEHLRYAQAKTDANSSVKQSQVLTDTPEVLAAKEEHQRLYNLVKQRDELQNVQTISSGTGDKESVVIVNPLISQELKSSALEQPYPVMDTPTVIHAQEERIKLARAEGVVPAGQQPYQSVAISAPIAEDIQANTNALHTSPVGKTFIQAHGQDQNVYSNVVVADGQVQYTPEVQRAREEHLRLVSAAQIGSPIHIPSQQIQQQSSDSAVDIEAEKNGEIQRIRDEKSFIEEDQRLRVREEERQRESDRLLEENRIREENRFMEIERLRLQQDEMNRLKLEGTSEGQTISKQSELTQGGAYRVDQQVLRQFLPFQSGDYGLNSQTQQQVQQTPYRHYQNNPFLYGAGVKSLKISDEGNAQVVNSYGQSNFQFPAGTHFLDLKSPLIVRYGPDGHPEFYTEGGLKLSGIIGNAAKQYQSTTDIKLKSSFPENIPTGATSGISYVVGVSGMPTGDDIQIGASAISELEKATRDHFRAHEIALEQLRLANVKDSTQLKKDCN